MKKLVVLFMLFSLVIVGCSTAKVWYSPTKSLQETKLDVDECKRLAEGPGTATRITNRPGYPSDQGAKLRNKLNDVEGCLKAKGYGLIEKSVLDSRGVEYYDVPPY
jgi:hypothetical protein